MEFREKLAHLIAHRHLTHEELGDALGVSTRAVGKWLNGSVPRPSVLIRLANYFGVKVSVLSDADVLLPDQPPTTAKERISKAAGAAGLEVEFQTDPDPAVTRLVQRLSRIRSSLARDVDKAFQETIIEFKQARLGKSTEPVTKGETQKVLSWKKMADGAKHGIAAGPPQDTPPITEPRRNTKR